MKESELYLNNALTEYGKREDVRKVMRFPQFLFQKLSKDRPKIADELLGSMYDFYYDEMLPEWKWEKVTQWWDKEAYK